MKVVDLGLVGYQDAWHAQLALAQDVLQGEDDTLVLCEHPPVLTLGASFRETNLLHSVEKYAELGIEVVRTDRGGDVTYHGPGQLVIYPVFDLRRHGQDLHRWMRDLEETIIVALAESGVEGHRFPPHTGVWTGFDRGQRKIAAIGVKVRKWVSIHGIALNCANDLAAFELIVPCGITGYGVTSLSQETGCALGPKEAKGAVQRAFDSVFTGSGRG